MFTEDLISFIVSDTSLNAMANIVFLELPVDFNSDEDWIVFDSTLTQRYSTFSSKSIAAKYDVTIQVVSRDVDNTVSIANRIKEHFGLYPNDYNIDAYLSEDVDPDWDAKRQVYYKTLKYSVLY